MTRELALSVVLRTPHGVAFEGPVRSLRVPTETGQVGLRPGGEGLVLAIGPGLLLLHALDEPALRFATTAGGLLRSDGHTCTLLTPFAAIGTEAEVAAALQQALRTPNADLAVRRRLGELERRILQQLPRVPDSSPSRGPHAPSAG